MWRTLSARILLGFGLLTVTFAIVVGTIIVNIRQLEDQVKLIGQGYVKLALESKDLTRRQEDLRKYLDFGDKENPRDPKPPEVDSATPPPKSPRISNTTLARYRNGRDLALAHARKVIEDLKREIDFDPKQFASSRPRLEALDRSIAAIAPYYDAIFAKPDPLDPQRLDLLDALRDQERKISSQTTSLADQTEHSVSITRESLEQNERIVRTRTIYLGLTAVVLGLLVTLWVVITLRPLRRLREGARRIASGDYASRIPERGPAEITDLAREFNSMGRAVEERERERVRAERLAAVGKMAAMITHEVRNPLSSIGLNAELLEDELGDNPEARNLCRAIHREVDRLTAITEEYLAFTRMPKPKRAPEAVNTLVGSLAAFVREDLAAKQIALVIELAPGDPIASVDAGQIRQCLINLVRNAAEAIGDHSKGTITLRTRHTGARVELEVQDDGAGIPPDVLPRLFDPFFSTKEGGNGLGLALTQQIVREHGGDLRVDSAVGRGTTFTVSVPVGG